VTYAAAVVLAILIAADDETLVLIAIVTAEPH
jgi:hypothetical protein